MSKYLKKYAEELKQGMRKDGKSVVECCLEWGILDTEYYKWLDEHQDLATAHQIGEMDCASWWHIQYRKLAQNGNASALSFGMKNIDKVGWQEKPENKKEVEEPIRELRISILPPRADLDE